MDRNATNPYTTEIPVSEAEKELRHTPPPPTSPAPPTMPPRPPAPNSVSKRLPTILIGILSVAIVFLAGYLFRGFITPPSSTPQPITSTISPTTIPTATPAPIDVIPTPDPTSNRFSSADLGIVFDTAKTLPDSGDKTVLTQIDGSRVYIYTSDTLATSGQYVDILAKISTDSTVMAVQKITVNDPRFATCTFEVSPQEIYPATYERVIPNCPNEIGGGLNYFLADSLHPTALLFVSIGQYSIDASSSSLKGWHDTLRFL